MNQQVLNVRLVNNAVLGSTEDSVGAHTVIGLLKQLYEKLRTSTGNTSINIGVIQGAIRNLENTVNGSTEVEPPIVGLTTQVANINTEINGTNGLRSQISAIESVNSDQNSEITSLKSRATNIEEINQQQTVKINDNEDDISALTNRVNAIDNSNDGRLTVVEHSVANLVSEVEGQDGALDDIIDLQADVGTLQTNVGTLQTDVTTLQQTVNNLPPGGVGQSTNQTGGERFNLYEANRNEASGDYSHAEGYLTRASGNYSHVEGSSNLASGESAHAEGTETKATHVAAHAEGRLCEANGIYSHAGGYNSKSVGSTSFAHGYECKANSHYSFAIGENTTASGSHSCVQGYLSSATGYYSFASGYGTYADSRSLTAVGRFNTYTSGLTSLDRRMFVVGNGLSTNNKSDAFVVNYDGSVIINSTRSGTTPSLTIGPNSKPITSTTAIYASTYPNDAILTTKHYVDEKTNSLQHFIYYGPINITYVSEIVNVALIDRTVTEFAIVYYDYNGGNDQASIIIPRLALDLTIGHTNVTSSSTFAFGIIQMFIDYLGYRFVFKVNKPSSGIFFHPCRGICEGVYYDDGSNPANQEYFTPTVYSGILSTVPNNSQSQGDLIVYAYTPIRAANNYGSGYDAISGRQICFKITYNPNNITKTSL